MRIKDFSLLDFLNRPLPEIPRDQKVPSLDEHVQALISLWYAECGASMPLGLALKELKHRIVTLVEVEVAAARGGPPPEEKESK